MRIMHICAILFALFPACAAFPAYADPNPQPATEKPPPLPERNPRFDRGYFYRNLPKCDSPEQLSRILVSDPNEWGVVAETINKEQGTKSCDLWQNFFAKPLGPVMKDGKPLYVVTDVAVYVILHLEVRAVLLTYTVPQESAVLTIRTFVDLDVPHDIYSFRAMEIPEAMRMSPEL